MPSIRKTKKRLKERQEWCWKKMMQLNALYPTMRRIYLWQALNDSVKDIEQELQQLKRKKI